MKILIFILFIILTSITGFSQNYTMQDGSETTCSGTFYDSGGNGSNYSISESFTMTFSPATAGDMLQFDFTSFSTESGYDDLTIYDGPDNTYPVIGVYDGTDLNGVTITASVTGDLTFVWSSDGSVTYAGWEASISCITPWWDCVWEVCLEDSYGDGWNGNSIDVYVAGSLQGNYTLASGSGPYCVPIQISDGDDIDLVIDLSGSYPNEVEYYLYDNLGTLTHAETSDPPGNYTENNASCASCGPPTSVTAGADASSVSPGTLVTYDYVSHVGGVCSGNWEYQWEDDIGTVLQSWSTTSTYTEVLSTLGTYNYYLFMRCSDCTSLTTQSNVVSVVCENCMTCANAPVMTMPYTFSGSTCGACDNYSSASACGSSYLNGDDYVFEYTPATNEIVDVSLTTDGTWVGVIVTEGCPDVGTCVVAITNTGANATGSATLTGGTTYYFTVSTYPSPQCINNFTLNVTPQCAPIFTLSDGGDNCPLEEFFIDVDITSLSGAASVAITNDGGAPPILGINSTGIQTIGPFPANTTVNVTVEDEATPACAGVDAYAILECPSCTDGIQNQGELGVDCGGPCPPCPPILVPTACTTVSHTLTSLASVTFYDDGDVGGDPCLDGVANNFCNCGCFTVVTICGAPGEYIVANFRDFAMFNTNSGFDWMVIYDNNTTSGTILFDNRAVGSANGEPPTFNTNCTTLGPDNPLGDCNYTNQLGHLCSSGNCLTFQFWATSVVNREGWDCLVTSVSVPCVLPVELTKLDYDCLDNSTVKLEWKTASETNNNYFTIERSTNAVDFEKIGVIYGQGNSNSETNYEFIDDVEPGQEYYYRLSQTDFDGMEETFDILYVSCDNNEVNIGPNPSIEGQPITIFGEYDNIIIKDMLGRIIRTDIIDNQILGLESGVYIIEIDHSKFKVVVE